VQQKITICLTNPKSPTNVGGALRAAGCFGADQILYTGNRYDIAKKYTTDTQNIAEQIPLTRVEDFVQSRPPGAKLVCVDLVEGAIPLPDYVHPEQACYVFGPEDGSLKQDIIDAADDVVYMPTIGSLNLAAAVNVLLYDRVAKDTSRNEGNDLIRQSRDVNNRLKVSS
jgi:tRNA(Leu) C34 or U34 (ribose-2'-O)-methylase TrmL